MEAGCSGWTAVLSRRIIMRDKVKEEIKTIFQEVFDDNFNVEIVIDKGARKPGDHKHVVEKETVPLLPFLAGYLPKIEGAIRGTQETMDNVKNKDAEVRDRLELVEKQMETVAGIMFQHQKEVTFVTRLVAKLGEIGILDNIKDKLQIESIEVDPEEVPIKEE